MTKFGKLVLLVSIVLITSLSFNIFMGIKLINLSEDNMKYKENLRGSNVHSLLSIAENKLLKSKIKRVKTDKEELIVKNEKNNEYIEVLKSSEISTEEKALRKFYEKETGKQFGEVVKADFELTKYTNSEGWWEKDDPFYGTMYNGERTYRGAVAAPRCIPIGSTVVVETEDLPIPDMAYEVGDRGGAIVKRNDGTLCIDIWVPEEQLGEAYVFGRRPANGYVIIPKEDD